MKIISPVQTKDIFYLLGQTYKSNIDKVPQSAYNSNGCQKSLKGPTFDSFLTGMCSITYDYISLNCIKYTTNFNSIQAFWSKDPG